MSVWKWIFFKGLYDFFFKIFTALNDNFTTTGKDLRKLFGPQTFVSACYGMTSEGGSLQNGARSNASFQTQHSRSRLVLLVTVYLGMLPETDALESTVLMIVLWLQKIGMRVTTFKEMNILNVEFLLLSLCQSLYIAKAADHMWEHYEVFLLAAC